MYAATAVGEPIKKQGQRMNLIVGLDFTSIKDVKISGIAGDQTANLNTADESYCAS